MHFNGVNLNRLQNPTEKSLDFSSKWGVSLAAEFKLNLPQRILFAANVIPMYASPHFNLTNRVIAADPDGNEVPGSKQEP